MEVKFETVKKLMRKELQSHYSTACQNCYNDVQRAFIHRGYHDVIIPMLERAESFDDLQDVLSSMDYGMDLQEWFDSL